jgi:hypothetical protein
LTSGRLFIKSSSIACGSQLRKRLVKDGNVAYFLDYVPRNIHHEVFDAAIDEEFVRHFEDKFA